MSDSKAVVKSRSNAGALVVGQPSRLISRGLNHLQQIQDATSLRAWDGPPKFCIAWGGEGTGIGDLSHPWGVALDSQGLVYVADYGNHRIQVFDETGAVRRVWGSWGSNPGQFCYPRYVAVDLSGRIVVADALNYRIQVFDKNGRFVDEWPCNHPEAIAVDGEGCVYVTSHGTDPWDEDDHNWIPSNVTVFSPHGKAIAYWHWDKRPWESSGLIYQYWGIAVGPDGEIFLGLVPNDASQWPTLIQKWDADGNVLAEWTGEETPGQDLGVPKGLATDRHGNVYVGCTFAPHVQKFDANGRFLWQLGDGPDRRSMFNNVTALAINDAGELYVADAGHDLVFKFSPTGR
jgi:DNA-binding beta-propeller fold protein YncE